MGNYVNEVFPSQVAKESQGGPFKSISVLEQDGGSQERSARWPIYRWEYEAGIGIKNLGLVNQVYRHHLCVGPENSFPFIDPFDNSSNPTYASNGDAPPTTTPGGSLDQVIGVGDGTNATFQLIKTYTFGGRSYIRNIRKPFVGTWTNSDQSTTSTTVTVSVGGVLKTLGTDFTLDTSTGVIVFQAGQIPANAAVVRASYRFYTPVFYGSGFKFQVAYSAVNAGRVPEVPLVEDVGNGALTPDFPYLGGGDTIAVSSNLLYDYGWGRAAFLNPNADGFAITLPDINELPFGGDVFTFSNIASSGPKTLTFKNRASGATEFTLTFGKHARVYVRNNAGARAWAALGGA